MIKYTSCWNWGYGKLSLTQYIYDLYMYYVWWIQAQVGVNSEVGVRFNSKSNSGAGVGVEIETSRVGVDVQETYQSWNGSLSSGCYPRSWSWGWYFGVDPNPVQAWEFSGFTWFQVFLPMAKTWASLTHWGRVTHICVGNLSIISSDNGLSPARRQAIIWTNAGILLIRSLGTHFREILSKNHTFSFKKMHLKTSSAKWRPSYLGLNVLIKFADFHVIYTISGNFGCVYTHIGVLLQDCSISIANALEILQSYTKPMIYEWWADDLVVLGIRASSGILA